jgi:hypothetical protein
MSLRRGDCWPKQAAGLLPYEVNELTAKRRQLTKIKARFSLEAENRVGIRRRVDSSLRWNDSFGEHLMLLKSGVSTVTPAQAGVYLRRRGGSLYLMVTARHKSQK